jgi:hypothetical protein
MSNIHQYMIYKTNIINLTIQDKIKYIFYQIKFSDYSIFEIKRI